MEIWRNFAGALIIAALCAAPIWCEDLVPLPFEGARTPSRRTTVRPVESLQSEPLRPTLEAAEPLQAIQPAGFDTQARFETESVGGLAPQVEMIGAGFSAVDSEPAWPEPPDTGFADAAGPRQPLDPPRRLPKS